MEMLVTGAGAGLRPLRVSISGRVAAWTMPNEPDDVLQFAGIELRRDLADALVMKQQNSGYDGFGNTLSGGPSR
jgi:hypothetical protein